MEVLTEILRELEELLALRIAQRQALADQPKTPENERMDALLEGEIVGLEEAIAIVKSHM